MASSLKSTLQSGALALVSMLVALLIAEGVSRLFIDPADFLLVTPAADESLGHRIAPGAAGHDKLGFRNRSVPEQADTVVIGDSMTYGFGTPRDSAWPHQLASLSGQSGKLYNMALGGYGPLQYLHLLRTGAPQFKPRQIVVGFYFGNDLFDAHNLAHGLPKWHDWRISTEKTAEAPKAPVQEQPTRRFAGLREWLSQNSLLYAMLKATVFESFSVMSQQSMARQMSPDDRMSWADPAKPELKTVFTPRDRLGVQDLTQSATREGMAITQRAFAAIQDEADRQKLPLLVVLIPTRERVYCPYLKSTGASLPPSFVKLCEAEEVVKAELLKSFAARGIAHVDSTPALEAEVAKHVQIYPPTSDGHPTALGHRAIAETVLRALKQPAAASR
jgi:hypothetical protein